MGLGGRWDGARASGENEHAGKLLHRETSGGGRMGLQCFRYPGGLGANTKPRGAFESDCGSWEASGADIFLFEVGFKNTTNHALTLVLRNLVLHSRDGRSFAPVNVRSQAKFPTSFLNEKQKLPPGVSRRPLFAYAAQVSRS